jgi:hypothetical protein
MKVLENESPILKPTYHEFFLHHTLEEKLKKIPTHKKLGFWKII